MRKISEGIVPGWGDMWRLRFLAQPSAGMAVSGPLRPARPQSAAPELETVRAGLAWAAGCAW